MKPVESPINLKVEITAREEWGEDYYSLHWDIQEDFYELLLSFGNGLWAEVRIVAESQDGLGAIRRVLHVGGYRPGSQPDSRATLFQQGDECWEGFVFIAPTLLQQ
jgi:hypothetical protein